MALEIADGTSAQNLAALDNAFCDIALASLASTRRLTDRYDHETLEASHLVLVVPANHHLARATKVPLRQLAGERILSMHQADEPDVHLVLDHRLREAGAVPTDIAVSHPRVLLSLVAAGLGVAVVPEFVVRGSREAVRALPIVGMRQQGGVVAVWNKRRLHEASRHFVALLRN